MPKAEPTQTASDREPAPDGGRFGLWALTALAITLLTGTMALIGLREHARVLDDAAVLSRHRADRLAEELTQSLALAEQAIVHGEARLARPPAGAGLVDLVGLLGDTARERAELLARLPLPFELHALDASGHAVNLAPGLHRNGEDTHAHERPLPPTAAPGRWHVGLAQGAPGARILPLLRVAAPNLQGVVAYAADFDHAALLRRLRVDLMPGGGVALFRIEADGSTTLLARQPFSDSELGQRVHGPLARELARAPLGSFDAVTQLDGTRRRVAYRRLDGAAADLVVVYGMTRDAALAGWRQQLPLALALVSLLSVVMLWGGWRLDRAWLARARASAALAQSEQRLREAQQLASIGSWALDLRSGVLDWSDEVYRIFELDPAQFRASYAAFLAVMHPDDRAAVDQAWQRAVAERSDYVVTHRLLLADGRVKHVHERGRASYAEDGTPLRALGTVQDVTARVLADQSLRESEARHRELFEHNPHPMWVYDVQTLAFLAVNERATRQYGYTREEFLRMTLVDIRPPEDVPRLRDSVANASGGFEQSGVWRHLTRDGRVLEVEINSHSLVFDGRRARLVLAHDVTRRNQAERALRDSEERLRLALQAANQGLYDLDLRTGEAVVSPEYAHMLGHDPAEFRETHAAWLERLHADDRDAVERAFEDYVAGRCADYRVEFRQRTRRGGWKWVLSVGRIQARDADGRPLRMLGTHTDLDAIKAAQAAELAATRRFETLFEAAPEAISVCESDGDRFVLVNNAFCDLFGYGREQVVGRSALELQLWTRAPARQELVQRLRAGESVQALEGAARRGDGGVVDVQFSAERIEFGGREALLLMFRDISERKRLDAALRASQARLAHLLARAPTVVYTARAEGDFAATYYSPNLPALLGWQPLDFVADSSFWLNHVHPDDRDAVLHELAALPTRDELALEYRFRHADGRWRWMRDQVSVQRDEQGAATELVGAWIDITERREAEEQVRRLATELEERVQERTAQLAQSEARYRTIFETVPISIGEEDWSEVQHLLRDLRSRGVTDGPGYFAARPDFVHDCLRAVKVRRLNRKALALHDAREQQTDLPDLQAVYPRPEDLPQFVGELEAMWAGQRLLTAKRSLPSVTGRPLRLMMTMSLPALDDTDGTALVCLVDITEIDRLNAELDRSVARLREANRELETFTYSVSHDLKAPLRGIDGYSRLLLAEHAERLDDEGRQFLAHIRQATQHMGTLIDDLLAYSRLERRALALAPLALGPVVDAALAGLRGEMEAAGAQLELALDPALRLRGDAQGLTMALRNLVDNALKFSRQRTPPRIRVTATQTRGGVAVSVVDNGVGFDMKFHDRIFAIFQRLHRAEDYPGTGVGLAIVRKAVERMGGRVWASSQPGEGACFTIELPEADAP